MPQGVPVETKVGRTCALRSMSFCCPSSCDGGDQNKTGGPRRPMFAGAEPTTRNSSSCRLKSTPDCSAPHVLLVLLHTSLLPSSARTKARKTSPPFTPRCSRRQQVSPPKRVVEGRGRLQTVADTADTAGGSASGIRWRVGSRRALNGFLPSSPR